MPLVLLSSSPRRRAIRFRRSDNRTAAKPARPPPRREEEKIHMAVVQHLETRGVPGLLCWHTPNEFIAHVAHRTKLKKLGAKAGVADLLFLHAGKFFALELKIPSGRLTDVQRDFIAAVIAAGGSAAIGRGRRRCSQDRE